MDDPEPMLSKADRRAIEAIRRRLDAEFRVKLDAEFGSLEDSGQVDTDSPMRIRRETSPRQKATRLSHVKRWVRHRYGRGPLLATLLLGIAGTALSVIATSFLWEPLTVRNSSVLSDPRVLPADVTNNDVVTPWLAVDRVALLREALTEWIEATQRGDIATQMRYYPEKVPVYYTWRNVPREAVQAEKLKVFGAASRLVITTDSPAVELTEDRLTATTRFRKRYVIEGPVVRRRGEVLQELRWTLTAAGWLIVGERDARVL